MKGKYIRPLIKCAPFSADRSLLAASASVPLQDGYSDHPQLGKENMPEPDPWPRSERVWEEE